ncbi:SH2 domain-containing protein [Geopyxis carbonaria]|nr:SH2 domain-containing protein [Geopyxis carbonaria]
MGDFIDREAELDSDEDIELAGEQYDEETGEVRRKSAKNAGKPRAEFDDSSEEEDDDDDEEAARIREGFIVDDEEDEEEELEDGTMVKVKKKKKRRRSQREEDEDDGLDEEDLDLMMENTGHARSKQSQFKRLKRGREESRRGRAEDRGLMDIFSDEELDDGGDDDDGNRRREGRDRRGLVDEFDDFIEESESEDEGGRRIGSDDDMQFGGASRKRGQRGLDPEGLGLREGAMADMQDIFSIDDYEDALVTEKDNAELEERTQDLQLKDVFEPSELAERLLTDEDNDIRWKDIPERLQLMRKPFANLTLTPEEHLEEAKLIAGGLAVRKNLDRRLEGPFREAVAKVLQLFNVENYEVPFIYQQRKDYLIHTVKIPRRDVREGEAAYDLDNEKMIFEKDLWEILEQDLKFRAFVEKRNHFKKIYEGLLESGVDSDMIVEERLQKSENTDHMQDLHEYVHFKYASQIKDIALINANGRKTTHRKPGSSKSIFERIRAGRVYNVVRAFGITAEHFSTNALLNKKREFPEDPEELPQVLAEQHVDPPEFLTGPSVLSAAKAMLAEEIYTNPMMRLAMRQKWFTTALIHVDVTEKGVKQIDEQHQYYEFKYLRNLNLPQIAQQAPMFLKMLKAETDGLIKLNVVLQDQSKFFKTLYNFIITDNYSEVAEAWNRERREVVDIVMLKFAKLFEKNLRDELKNACEDLVARSINEVFSRKLDQAPYKPKALELGEIPRVFALSNGQGEPGRDAIVGVFFDEDKNYIEQIKVDDLREPEKQEKLVTALRKNRPDVIGIAGFSVRTHRLAEDLRKLIDEHNILVADEGDEDERTPIEVVYVNDEVARLYQNSDRAKVDHPDLPPLGRYCCALARYLQNPLLEYAALGKDIVVLAFHPAQNLLPEERLRKALDSAMVDMVNLVGVDINEAIRKPYIANLLPYVCGLGPRKTTSLLKTIGMNGGKISNRQELIGITEREGAHINAAVGPKVFENCASFLTIPHSPKERDSDYFDGTRVHPEEYELGRKMAADAMDLDEEDVSDIVRDQGKGAVVNILVKDHVDRLNELILEEYAEELERNFNQKKRATLEAIRGELMSPYEELRAKFLKLSVEEVFTMLTGETKESLDEGMVVPVNIRRVTDRYVMARLDCGIDGNVAFEELADDANHKPSNYYSIGQTVQARIESLSRKTFYAELSLKEDKIRQRRRRLVDVPQEDWDDEREERDRARMAVRNQEQARTVRVIKHPLFKTYNSRQAEEFLSGQSRGDTVIRPSSNGPDHIAVTWKVSDGIYQHLDVLELDKKNEFTVGRTLRVGQKYSYSDLDELIVNHVKAMAKKVDELSNNSKFQAGSTEDTAKWLEKYCEANPKRSSYAFCLDPKKPGYFLLLFKAGAAAKMGVWPVKVIPGAFQLRGTAYPNVITLCNGFKTMHQHMMESANGRSRGH